MNPIQLLKGTDVTWTYTWSRAIQQHKWRKLVAHHSKGCQHMQHQMLTPGTGTRQVLPQTTLMQRPAIKRGAVVTNKGKVITHDLAASAVPPNVHMACETNRRVCKPRAIGLQRPVKVISCNHASTWIGAADFVSRTNPVPANAPCLHHN